MLSDKNFPLSFSANWLKKNQFHAFLLADSYNLVNSSINLFLNKELGKKLISINSSEPNLKSEIKTSNGLWFSKYIRNPNHYWNVLYPEDKSWFFLYGVDYYIFASKNDILKKIFNETSILDFKEHAKKIAKHKSLKALSVNMLSIYKVYEENEVLYR